ncbi:MAG: phosphopantetheine-binding protein [Streptosporangiaceae bacterium]|jgi:acyl carrier protein
MKSLAPEAIKEAVAQAWCTALRLETLPPKANIFTLGGDSLIAVMIAADIGDRLGAEIGLTDLLEAPEFEDFAARVATILATLEGRE